MNAFNLAQYQQAPTPSVTIPNEVLAYLMLEYLSLNTEREAENTRRSYMRQLQLFGEFCNGDLSDSKLLQFKLQRIDKDRDGNYRAARMSNLILSVVKNFMRFLQQKRMVTHNYFELVDSAKVDKYDSPYVALTDTQVRTMINHPNRESLLGSAQRLALVLGFYLGLRRDEICKIQLKHFENGVLRVKGKGRKVRYIPIDERVQEEIDAYMAMLGLHKNELGPEWYLLQSRESHGKAIDPTTLWRWYTNTAKACNIEVQASPHSARATAITKALDEGASIRDVGNFAGHASIDTTTIYDKRRASVREVVTKAIRY